MRLAQHNDTGNAANRGGVGNPFMGSHLALRNLDFSLEIKYNKQAID